MKKLISILSVICVLFINNAMAQKYVVDDFSGVITSQPAVTVGPACENAGLTVLTMAVTGTDTTFQWQEFIVAWNNISNGGIFSGVNTASLTLTNAPLTYNGRQYRCIVSSLGACGGSVTSNPVAINILANPTISVQPTNQTVCQGLSTSFSVTAAGAGLTYVWRKGGVPLVNGGVLSNVTTATMNISDVTGQAGTYDCLITGTCGVAIATTAVTLAENTPIIITTEPVSPAIICAGTANQTMSVVVTGTNPTYVWRENGAACVNDAAHSGVSTSTLTLINPNTINNYDVVVTGTCSSVTSAMVNNPLNLQATIITAPTAQSVCTSGSLIGNTATFSVVAVGATGYQWQKKSVTGVWSNASGVPYGGELTADMTVTDPIDGTNIINGGFFRCILTTAAGCNATMTTPVDITIKALPLEPTWLTNNQAQDTVHKCNTSLATMTLNPTQVGATYQLEDWPSLAPVGVVQNGNGGLKTWANLGAGGYTFYIQKNGCAIRQK